MGRIEISDKLIHVRFYGRHVDNYEASCFIFKDGERGVVTGLEAENFYNNFELIFARLQEKYGINILHGSVTKAHARLIRMKFAKLRRFSVTFEFTFCEGREMFWITCREK